MNKRIIVWEHIQKPNEMEYLAEPEEGDASFEESEEGFLMSQPTQVVPTPFGLFLKDDQFNPMNRFDFWEGNTNFPINHIEKDILDNIEGVEALVIRSKYQFWVAPGKCFSFAAIRANIQQILCGEQDNTQEVLDIINNIEDTDIKNNILTVMDDLSKKYQQWAVYVFPNGSIEYTFNDNTNLAEYQQMLDLFYDSREQSGGLLILPE